MTMSLWVCVCSVKREGLQFPVWDAYPVIAPLHPDRSFGKYGEHSLTCTNTHPFLCHTSERGMGNNLETRARLYGFNHYQDIT